MISFKTKSCNSSHIIYIIGQHKDKEIRVTLSQLRCNKEDISLTSVNKESKSADLIYQSRIKEREGTGEEKE